MTATTPELVPILMYHSVAESAHRIDLPFTVRTRDFERHVDALRAWGATTVDVATYGRALRGHRPIAPRTVVITVDDGYSNTAERLAPQLAAAGMTATVFVSTATIGRSVRGSRMIAWSQLHELLAMGFEVGAHSHHHLALDTVPLARATEEMVRSREVLEDTLQTTVTSFAYPHGYWTPPLTRLAEDAGFLAACAAKNSLSHPDDDLFALSRIVVPRNMTSATLLDAVDGRSTRVRTSPRTIQRGMWRLARRVGPLLRPDPAMAPRVGAPSPHHRPTAGSTRGGAE